MGKLTNDAIAKPAGNILFHLIYSQPSPRFLIWPVVLRAAFIPFFLFCNYHPLGVVRNLPVYINNDYIYWGVAVVMSYSSGYLSSLAMMYAPGSQTNPQYQITAGMMAAAMLISGIFVGILFSSLFPEFAAMTLSF
jgi:solute carrier family 29 (equilibrative nucleoside transporter), member 1/2/3